MADRQPAHAPEDAPDGEPQALVVPAPRRGQGAWARVIEFGRTHQALSVVISAYAATAMLLPAGANVLAGDDWAYARLVEDLVQRGSLHLSDASGANALFDTLWGALFATALSDDLWVLRLSTLALNALAAIAIYALCIELKGSRPVAALASACWLFNPLSMVMGYTFYTDPHFSALVMIAAFFYARGIRADRVGHWSTWGGSCVAGLAFWSRQPGILIPLAVLIASIATRRITWNREGMRQAIRVALVPAIMFAGFQVWAAASGTPGDQGSFVDEFTHADLARHWALGWRMSVTAAAYVGFFALPFAVAFLGRIRSARAGLSWRVWAWTAGLLAPLGAGLVVFTAEGRRMPYVPNLLRTSGLGTDDVVGRRPDLFTSSIPWDVLTAACVVSLALVVLALARAGIHKAGQIPHALSIVIAITAAVLMGALLPSYEFFGVPGSQFSFDRYLLPMLPLVLVLSAWAVRDIPRVSQLVALALAPIALISVAGTRDFLVLSDRVWRSAEQAVSTGADVDQVDGGGAWTRYRNHGVTPQASPPFAVDFQSWWIWAEGSSIDQRWVVSTVPLENAGYEKVRESTYVSWLRLRKEVVYLYLRTGPSSPSGHLPPPA